MVNTKIIKVPKEKGGTTVIYNNSGSAGSGGSSIQTATELEYHYLWGQPFNGTQDVNGSMEVDGNVTATNLSAIHSVSSPYVNVSEILRAARADVSTLNASDASITNLDSSNITTEYLTVTKQAHFFELIIDELRAVGGQVILSPARAKIELVEQQNNGSYICYFLAKDSDGEQVRNNFLANDQVICQTFNVAQGLNYNVSNKYYWRLVTDTNFSVHAGTQIKNINGKECECHFVILSDSVKDGSSIPEAGDEIVTLGYRGNDDAARQSAIILAAYQTPDSGLECPCIAQYVGINDFNLASHRYSYQAANGNKFVGDFSIIDNGTQTDIQDYIDTVAENLNSSINNSQTDFYKIQLTQASVSVDINDNLNVNVLGCVKHYYGNTVETLENPSQYVSVSLYFNATGETMAATWTDSPANYFRFSSNPHTQNFSTQTNQPKFCMVRMLFVGQTQLIDSVVIPVVFDSGSIFQVKSDAITAAVQSANTYTDGSILTVNNRIADVSLTANGLSSTVQSHTTSIDTINGSIGTLNSSVSQIFQTADSISTRVTAIENESYVSESTLLQTANQIKAQINTSLGATGIDITNQLITISAANTSINGNLNLYDSYNNGLTIYDENSIPRVNLQSDAIDSIADLATDTYTHYTLSGSGSVTNRYDMTTNQQSITLAQYETLDLDKFNVYLYASNGSTNSYPTSYTGHVVIRIQYPDNSIHTYDKLVFKRDNYGNYGIDAGYRFSAPTSGTYKISFNGWTGGEFTGTQTVYLSVNCRWQTAANAQTYIGRDGFYSHAGANKLIWSGESELQLRYGFNGIRWKDVENKFNSAMEVAANVKGTSPNNKVVWLPFYNYIPTFSVGTGTAPYLFTSQSVGNINETKYAFRIDAYRDRGVCLVKSGYLDSNFNEQESWVILPPTTFTDSDGETASLPVGYTVTIINWTRTNIYVVPYSASYHGVTIEDANRNQNYFCELNGTQSRDTYIYVSNYAGAAQWLSMHDTQ